MEYEEKKIKVPFKIEEVKEIEIGDELFYEFEGHGAVFENVDLVDDLIKKGAFKRYIKDVEDGKEKFPLALWQHQHDMPVGIYISLKEDSKGLFVKGRMPKADTFVSGRVVPQMKVGSVRSLSIGYRPIKISFEEIDGDNIRILEEIKLWEISLVSFPANPLADVTHIKAAIKEIETLSDIEKLLKQNGSFTNKEAKAIISKINELKGNRDDELKKKQLADEKVLDDMVAEFKKQINKEA